MFPLIAVFCHHVCNVIFKHLVWCAYALIYINLHVFSVKCVTSIQVQSCIFMNSRMNDSYNKSQRDALFLKFILIKKFFIKIKNKFEK